MSGIATAIGASAAIGYFGSQSAANTEVGAANNATNTQLQMFGQEQKNLAPDMQAGTSVLPELESAANPGAFNFQADPGYQFDVQQGQAAIQRSGAASGFGSGTLASLGAYTTGMASNEYNNAYQRYQESINNNYNRLLGVAQLGASAAGGTNQAAMNAGTNISNNTMSAGNAMAAGTVAGTNAISGAINSGVNAYTLSNFLAKQQPQTIPTTGQTNWAGNEEGAQPAETEVASNPLMSTFLTG